MFKGCCSIIAYGLVLLFIVSMFKANWETYLPSLAWIALFLIMVGFFSKKKGEDS